MSIDVDGITRALAARFDPAQVAAPAGLQPIRQSWAYGPDGPPVAPFVVTNPPENGRLTFGGRERAAVHEFTVDLYLEAAADMARKSEAVAKWLTVFLDQLIVAGTQLGGIVDLAWIGRYETGNFTYAEVEYPGIRLFVSVTTSDGISPVS